MKKQFVTYEIALKLKELGFDEPCLAFYDTHLNLQLGHKSEYLINNEKANYIFGNDKIKILLAPLYQQVIDWFRDVYKIHISIIPFNDEEGEQILYEFVIHESDWNDTSDYTYYHSYQEAREEAILKCIRLCQMEK